MIGDRKKTAAVFLALASLLCFLEPKEALNSMEIDPFAAPRRAMLENDLKGRDIRDPAVLTAMEKVNRHLFVDENMKKDAYRDYPLPLGAGQTISQPYIVALMSQCLALRKQDRILEIGTGSGYQAAILAELAGAVYSIEINKTLADNASKLLKKMGYQNIWIKEGDGFFGWAEHAPFDAIILTCSTDKIPPLLIKQLREGGKIILPLGDTFQVQTLVLGIKKGADLILKNITPVRFVPMRGEAEKGN
ncbi:MAG: protein-L-isoaspartate(D-aspartate) O-methyltransferase [Pseudomonadota bacterium]